MVNYDSHGLTLVWGLPLGMCVQELAGDILNKIKDIEPDRFMGRSEACLHSTIGTLKKVPKEASLADESQWPLGLQEALYSLQKQLQSKEPLSVRFQGLTYSKRGEILLCGFPENDALCNLRGELSLNRFWQPRPWWKGNLHITLGYFRHSLTGMDELMRLQDLLESYDGWAVHVQMDFLKLVHFYNRNLTSNAGSVEIPHL